MDYFLIITQYGLFWSVTLEWEEEIKFKLHLMLPVGLLALQGAAAPERNVPLEPLAVPALSWAQMKIAWLGLLLD